MAVRVEQRFAASSPVFGGPSPRLRGRDGSGR
jgi:hypothetical protein